MGRYLGRRETTGHKLADQLQDIQYEYELAKGSLLTDALDRRETVASRLSTLESEDRVLARLLEAL